MIPVLGIIFGIVMTTLVVRNAPVVVQVRADDVAVHAIVTDIRAIEKVSVRCGHSSVPMKPVSTNHFVADLSALADKKDPACEVPGTATLVVRATNIDQGEAESRPTAVYLQAKAH